MQLDYSINVSFTHNNNNQKQSRAQLSCRTFPFLAYLSINQLPASKDVVAELKAQLADPSRPEFEWGADFCVITTQGPKSIAEHNDMSAEDWRNTYIQTQLTTDSLLTLMEDWLSILTAISK